MVGDVELTGVFTGGGMAGEGVKLGRERSEVGV